MPNPGLGLIFGTMFGNPWFGIALGAASLLLTGLLDGRAGYRELFWRLGNWRVGWRWYAAAVAAGPLPLLAAAILLAALFRSPEFLPASLTAPAHSDWSSA